MPAEKHEGMQIITFDNAERQKRETGPAFTKRGLEVNMRSNYILEHFNYVATQERNGQKDGQKHKEPERKHSKKGCHDREWNLCSNHRLASIMHTFRWLHFTRKHFINSITG